MNQLESWFGAVNNNILKIAENHSIGLGGPHSEGVFPDLVALLLWLGDYTANQGIARDTVTVCLTPELQDTVWPQALTKTRRQLGIDGTGNEGGYLALGFPISSDKARNYIFIPFHTLIELEVLNSD